jgi:hypothetical protein
MLRRQFFSLLRGAAFGSPRAAHAEGADTAQLLEEVERLRRQLAEVHEQKIELLTMVSQMRPPLFTITASAEMILNNINGDTPEEMRFALRNIGRGGMGVAELIKAVFERAKQRANG